MKRFLAQRRLPSMMMAMCCGKGLWGALEDKAVCVAEWLQILEASDPKG
jgi:hypothetical protein